jgi:hypothetical protein
MPKSFPIPARLRHSGNEASRNANTPGTGSSSGEMAMGIPVSSTKGTSSFTGRGEWYAGRFGRLQSLTSARRSISASHRAPAPQEAAFLVTGAGATDGTRALPLRSHGQTTQPPRTRVNLSTSAGRSDDGHLPQVMPHGSFALGKLRQDHAMSPVHARFLAA